MSSKLKFLSAFAEHGIGILPLAPETNAPAVAGGASAAVTAPKTLKKFFKKYPTYNYGIALTNEVFIVRANNRSAKRRLDRLAADHGERLARTVTLRIDRARLYIFSAPGAHVRGSIGLLGKGIDIMVESIVPGPGSHLPTGAKCRFARCRTFSEVKVARAASWLIKLIADEPPGPKPGGGINSNASAIAVITETIREHAADAIGPKSPTDVSTGLPVAATGEAVSTEITVDAPVLQLISIPISSISVKPAHLSDLDHVCLLEESIEVLGIRTPITVMRGKSSGNSEAVYEIVTGHARLDAMKRGGADRVDALIFDGDEVDAKLWSIAENVDRRVPSILEVADNATEFDRLFSEKLDKGVQDAPPGGVQPNDKGLRKAAKRLGVSREKMRRRRLVSGLSEEAKAEAKALGLQDNESALLDAAKLPTPEGQISKLRQRAARQRRSNSANRPARAKQDKAASKSVPSPAETESSEPAENDDIHTFLDRRPLPPADQQHFDLSAGAELNRVKLELAETVERLHRVEEELDDARAGAFREYAAHVPMVSPLQVDMSLPADLTIPAFLDRRALSSGDQRTFDEIIVAYRNAPQVVQDRVRAAILGES